MNRVFGRMGRGVARRSWRREGWKSLYLDLPPTLEEVARSTSSVELRRRTKPRREEEEGEVPGGGSPVGGGCGIERAGRMSAASRAAGGWCGAVIRQGEGAATAGWCGRGRFWGAKPVRGGIEPSLDFFRAFFEINIFVFIIVSHVV